MFPYRAAAHDSVSPTLSEDLTEDRTEDDNDPAEASGRRDVFRGLHLLTPKPRGLLPGEGTQAAG